MSNSEINWYDTVMDLEREDERKRYRPFFHCEKGFCTTQSPSFSFDLDTNNWYAHGKNEPLRILVNSQNDVVDPCNEAYLEELHRTAEEIKHQYFVFTKHPLAFIQKPLFHRNNIWTGVSFAANTGHPFGAEELLQVFPNSNWIWHIDLNIWAEAQTSMIKRGIKWLILDCEKQHKDKDKASLFPCLELLLKQADKENIPVFMSNRLSEIVTASMCRRTLPEDLKARMKCI